MPVNKNVNSNQYGNDALSNTSSLRRRNQRESQAYEDYVKDTNASIEAKSEDIVNKSESKAKAETDLVEANKDKEAVMLELEQLSNYKADKRE